MKRLLRNLKPLVSIPLLLKVIYFGERPWWPIQSPNKEERRRKAQRRGSKIIYIRLKQHMRAAILYKKPWKIFGQEILSVPSNFCENPSSECLT